MKKYLSLFLVAFMFVALITGGCGGPNSEFVAMDAEESSFVYEDTDSTEGRSSYSDETVNLSTLKGDYTAPDGCTLTGTLGANVKISIADGAAVTLKDVTIDGVDSISCNWAGITCEGDATLILEGSNSVKGFYTDYPGIHVPQGKTLTIRGSGSLKASSNGYGSGIGGGLMLSCGNISISEGTITATGGYGTAGIGGGYMATFGNISITGGTVEATGGFYGAGIGGGGITFGGTITIADTVTKVTATHGGSDTGTDPNSIGAGLYGSCGTVTIGDKVGATSDKTYTYEGTVDGTIAVEINDQAIFDLTYNLYGRKVVGNNADGTQKLGYWVKLISKTPNKKIETGSGVTLVDRKKYQNRKMSGYADFSDNSDVPSEASTFLFIDKSAGYVEFGFEFDVKDGYNWPYSDVFWTAGQSKKEALDKIYIGLSGTILFPDLELEVNDRTLVDETYKSGGVPYYFRTNDKIRVKTWKTGLYSNKYTNFYARKAGNDRWDLLINAGDGDHEIYIDDDYKDFGFEFDINDGTDWPYSNVFWLASEQTKTVNDIYIEMGGTIRQAAIDIAVNGIKVVHEKDCDGHSPHDWPLNLVKVVIDDKGNYITKSKKFWGRKEGGGWECLLSEGNGDYTRAYSHDYVDFGFEFDITGGYDWPYSAGFWHKSDHPNDIVDEIDITIGGYSALFGAEITVDVYGQRNGKGDTVNLYHYHNDDLDDDDEQVHYGW